MNKILFSENLKTRRIECGYKTQYALAKEYNQRFPSSRKNRKEENIKNSKCSAVKYVILEKDFWK